MPEIDTQNALVTQINQIVVEPENQDTVLRRMREQLDDTVRHAPGFRSSTLHASIDGTRIVNYVHFDSVQELDAAHDDPAFVQHWRTYQPLTVSGGPAVYRIVYSASAEPPDGVTA